MKLTERTDEETGDSIFEVKITELDMLVVPTLDDFDRRLLLECNKSDRISDKLLAFHTIARKIEGADRNINTNGFTCALPDLGDKT